MQRALALRARASARERALIDALATRFAADGVGDRPALDRAYAAAMRQVAARYPEDPDVQTFFADAVMNTMPWDYWQKDGAAKPDTATVIAALEARDRDAVRIIPARITTTSTWSKPRTIPIAPWRAPIAWDR